jgi:hypothetical protein
VHRGCSSCRRLTLAWLIRSVASVCTVFPIVLKQQQQQQKSCCTCCCSKSSSAMPSAGLRRSSRKRNLLCAGTQRGLSSLPVLVSASSKCTICCLLLRNAAFACKSLRVLALSCSTVTSERSLALYIYIYAATIFTVDSFISGQH